VSSPKVLGIAHWEGVTTMNESASVRPEEDEILAVLEHDLFGTPGELRDTLTDIIYVTNYGCGEKK
jgi:hypothetical protein